MELTAVIEQYQERLQARYGAHITPAQQHALDAIMACRTERYGEIVLKPSL